MRIVIVGERDGRAAIQWPQYISLSLILSLVMGLGVGACFHILAGRWSVEAMLFGIVIGSGLVGIGLIKGLTTPPEKLTPLD